MKDDTMIVVDTLVSFGADVYVDRPGVGSTGAALMLKEFLLMINTGRRPELSALYIGRYH